MRSALLGFVAWQVAVVALAGPASAQRFDKVVAFGDSYADIGNVRAILNGAGLGALYPEAEYPTGRFSGGTNFVDTIAASYGIAQDNYAIGGAQAGTGNVAAQGLLPGFQQQWTAFTQGGSTYTDLALTVPIYVSGVQMSIPAGGLSFSPDDLVVFSVGGNDARPYRRTGTLEGAPAAADAAAAQATAGIDALVERGIKHLVFTAGDVGQLAEAVGQPDAPVGTAFSTEYNSRMQATLSRIAAGGVQVAYVDITQIGNVVRADPARFGFIDTVTACPQQCIGDPALQSRYFFYVDGIHLTSAAFALVGEYAVNQINAPYGLRADGDLPRLAAQGFGRAMDSRLNLARGGAHRAGLTAYAQFTDDHDHYRADATSDGYRYRSRGGVGGIEYRTGSASFGAMASYASGHVDGRDDDRARARSYQLGGYGVIDDGRFFAQAYAGIGWHDVRVRRTGVADPLAASPHARSQVAGARAGWLAPIGAFRLGPTVAIDYAHARLGGYIEANDAAASLTVGAQRSEALLGSAGIEARFTAAGAIVPWLRVAAEKALDGDGRTVRYAPTIAPTIGNAFVIDNSSRRLYGSLTGGVATALKGPVSINFEGRATFSRDTGNQVAGFLGVSLNL